MKRSQAEAKHLARTTKQPSIQIDLATNDHRPVVLNALANNKFICDDAVIAMLKRKVAIWELNKYFCNFSENVQLYIVENFREYKTNIAMGTEYAAIQEMFLGSDYEDSLKWNKHLTGKAKLYFNMTGIIET